MLAVLSLGKKKKKARLARCVDIGPATTDY